jgi:hypothetical protein
MNADIARLGRAPVPPVSATPSGRINCDSCHRSHEAVTAGGYYILEVISSSNRDPQVIHPPMDYTVVCHSCHDPQKY